jgi:acyl-CoA thioester hydrolase
VVRHPHRAGAAQGTFAVERLLRKGSDPVPRVLIQRLVVPDDVIDVNGHVNNLAYLQWMQDAAIAHSEARGWPVARYVETGTGWVVRSHFIEYLVPLFREDHVALLTWVTTMRRKSSARRFLFWRERDQQVIARAETIWVFVTAATGRPALIPSTLASAFELVPPDEEVLSLVRKPSAAADRVPS